MKKCLMMVASKAQLVIAFHIRNKMLTDRDVDIILLTETFDDGYVERLSGYFDNVWLVKSNYFTQREFLKYLFNPAKALRSKIDKSMDFDYSDVYNWDPGWCFYYLVRVDKLHKRDFKYHLIQDALGNYVISSLDFSFMHIPRNSLEKIIFGLEKRILHILPFHYDDEYVWKPELRVVPYTHSVISVPPINREDRRYITDFNSVFDFNKRDIRYLKGKYLYLDTIPEAFYDYTVNLVKELNVIAAPDDISVYVHPRAEVESYSELYDYANILKCPLPWELFYINKMTDGKTIFGIYTSAMAMGYIACNDCSDVYSFVKLLNDGQSPLCLDLFERIASYNNHFHLIHDIEEML